VVCVEGKVPSKSVNAEDVYWKMKTNWLAKRIAAQCLKSMTFRWRIQWGDANRKRTHERTTPMDWIEESLSVLIHSAQRNQKHSVSVCVCVCVEMRVLQRAQLHGLATKTRGVTVFVGCSV
jgi:hypothetical protein